MHLYLVLLVKKNLSESSLEHQTWHAGLAQSNLPDSIFGNLKKKKTRFLRIGKISLLGGVGKVLFSCLKCYSKLLLIRSMHGYLPPEDQKRLQQLLH